MPSVILASVSGGQNILSGAYPLFQPPNPLGSILVKADVRNSGFIYMGFSGGVTVTSGTFVLSGITGGMLDGMQIAPGQAVTVQKCTWTQTSGTINIFMAPDAACSGHARVYWQPDIRLD